MDLQSCRFWELCGLCELGYWFGGVVRQKISLGWIGGQILVNGYPKVQKTFTHVEGYVKDFSLYAPTWQYEKTLSLMLFCN